MHRRKGRNDFEVAVKKFLEHNRDPGRRLKSLKHAEGTYINTAITVSLDMLSFSWTEKAPRPSEVKQLYCSYSSAIFFVFYTYFGALESAILERGMQISGHTHTYLPTSDIQLRTEVTVIVAGTSL